MPGGRCFAIVRAAGERTEAACARLAAAQVGDGNVEVIHEVPFSAAIRRGFELGVEAGCDWTLCLDADVLLRAGAVDDLCDAAEAEWAASPDLFEIEGMVADKLLGQIRPAGAHLYRTSLLPRALSEVAFDPGRRRPESWVKKQMDRLGFRNVQIDTVLGLHDHEQYHRDIFRKVFTHTRKHERYMGYAVPYWKRSAATDEDHRTAYLSHALSAAINDHVNLRGVSAARTVSIDMRGFATTLDAILLPAGMSEKAPLAGDAITPEEVSERLAAFETAPEFLRRRHLIALLHEGRIGRVRDDLRHLGPAGTARAVARRLSATWTRRLGQGGS